MGLKVFLSGEQISLKNNGISLIVFFSQSYDIRKVKK